MASLRRIAPGTEREAVLPLLLLADDVAATYLHDGDLWVLDDAEGVVGAVLTIGADEAGTVELRNVAVAEHARGRGTGQAMVAALRAELRVRGWRRAIVGTGNADARTYVFYQRCGFRLWRIERDHFSVERGYDPALLVEPNGLVHRDMVWFDIDL